MASACARRMIWNRLDHEVFSHTRVVLLDVLAFVVLLSTCQSASAQTSFRFDGRDYACGTNLICLGDARISAIDSFPGVLSLTSPNLTSNFTVPKSSPESSGIAYYSQPIRFLDPSTHKSASFSTSFTFHELPRATSPDVFVTSGHGLTFVISADNSTVGVAGKFFGFFNDNGETPFESVMVEFDSFPDYEPLISDISSNHISFNFHNVTAAIARNGSDLDLFFAYNVTTFAWVEYTAPSQILEMRFSQSGNRPASPFLTYQVDLSQWVDEFMWVGFTGSYSTSQLCSYHVGNWSFESSAISDSVTSRSRSRARGSILNVAVVGAVVGASVLLTALVFILAIWVAARTRNFALQPGYNNSSRSHAEDRARLTAQMGEGWKFTYEELSVATDNFADDAKLGEGGFGCVYRGHMPHSNLAVAVKRVTRELEEGEREFRAEVSVISQLRHRNLIRLLGWCAHGPRYYIVYELMPRGSLDKLLFRQPEKNGLGSIPLLSWPQRWHILEGVAAAVNYLHNGWDQRVIHRDIKCSNIMLDDAWNAKLGDFGLARLTDHQRTTPSSTIVAGTYGYVAPEAILSRRFTHKTDIFAFGALALELACGRKAVNLHFETSAETFLVDWVWENYGQGKLLTVVDKRLGEQFDQERMETLLLLGLICSHPDPAARPTMYVVEQVLRGDAGAPPVPLSCPRPVYESVGATAG